MARADLRPATVVGDLAAAADCGQRASGLRPESLLVDHIPVVRSGLRDRNADHVYAPRPAATRGPRGHRRQACRGAARRGRAPGGRLGSPRHPLLRGLRHVIGLCVVVGRRLPRPGALARTGRRRARVAYELALQSVWAYCAQLSNEIEHGHDPSAPEDWGWRYLRGARCRLANPRPQESGQHRSMREAILDTSGLARQLDQAIDTLREGVQ